MTMEGKLSLFKGNPILMVVNRSLIAYFCPFYIVGFDCCSPVIHRECLSIHVD